MPASSAPKAGCRRSAGNVKWKTRAIGSRLTVCAGVGHAEGRGDAFRREEEIAGFCAELAVKIDSEGIAAFDGLGLIGACSGHRLSRNNRGATEQHEKKRIQELHACLRADAQKASADRRSQRAAFLAPKKSWPPMRRFAVIPSVPCAPANRADMMPGPDGGSRGWRGS